LPKQLSDGFLLMVNRRLLHHSIQLIYPILAMCPLVVGISPVIPTKIELKRISLPCAFDFSLGGICGGGSGPGGCLLELPDRDGGDVVEGSEVR
jgi:hypothetical protein